MKILSEHLEILAAIIEKGGLTEGAEELGKSQPSVSRTMALLEDRIGLPLFEPGRRPRKPTEIGRALARLGQKIRTANQEASLLVDRFRQGLAGRLRVAGSPIFMDGVVARLLADFQTQFSGFQIDQTYGYIDTLEQGIRNGGLDLAILPLNPRQVPDDMEFLPLLPGHNVIACRAGHPLTRTAKPSLADTEAYPWVAPPANSPLHKDLLRILDAIGRDNFNVSFSGGTLASIQSVLCGSDSLSVLPFSVVFLSRGVPPLAALPLKIGHPDRQLGILRSRASPCPVAADRLAIFLVGRCRELEFQMELQKKSGGDWPSRQRK